MPIDYRREASKANIQRQAEQDSVSRTQDLLTSYYANLLGAPVDTYNMMQGFSDPYNVSDTSEVDTMSSDWLKKKMQDRALKSNRQYPVEELLMSLASPDPTDLAIASKLGPAAASIFLPRKWSSDKGQAYLKDLQSGQYTREEMWAKHRMDHQLTPGRLVEEIPTDTVDFRPPQSRTSTGDVDKSDFKDKTQGKHSLYYSLGGLEDIEGIPSSLLERVKNVAHLRETNLNYNGSFNPATSILSTSPNPTYRFPKTEAEFYVNQDRHSKTLNHELQHVISDYYRMAEGGNPEVMKTETLRKLQTKFEKLKYSYDKDLSEGLTNKNKLTTFKKNLQELGVHAPSSPERFLEYMSGVAEATTLLRKGKSPEALKALSEMNLGISRELKKDPIKLKKILDNILSDDEMFKTYLEPQLKLRKAGAMSKKFDKRAYNDYLRLSDEQLANTAAERRYMTDEEIRAEPPWTSKQHFPLEKQIVKFK